MRVLFINSVCGTGSTGKICVELAKEYEAMGYEVKIAYGRSDFVLEEHKKYAVRIGDPWGVKLHAIRTRIADQHGLGSRNATKAFLRWADEYAPDILWLHNIHGYYLNYELLFGWIKDHPNLEVKWTLHDCWAFTGHCAYFSMADCSKWKKQCEKCIQKKAYPSSYFIDNSFDNFCRKQSAFTGVKKMTIITPSKWLSDLVKESFLKEYPVEIVYNTINTDVFKPTKGDFRKKYGLENKKIILGVASIWDARKGLNDYYKLAEILPDDYKIVLVGLNDKQMIQKPQNVLGIKRTANQRELAEIYSAANMFLNLTYEDNYPTVNLEARACGTPIITYNSGGSPESAGPDAIIIEEKDVTEILNAVLKNT